MRFCFLSNEIESTAAVGGKARSLAALSGAGLPVPPFFVVHPDAFYASLSPEARAELERAESPERIRSLVESVKLSVPVLKDLQRACGALFRNDELLAVRSSAQEEDSASHSFAGQLESFLFVSPDRVGEHLLLVWRSGFSERLIAYRREAGFELLPTPPAVVVQVMVGSESSGVAFSADPVSGRRAIAVVTAVPGLGSALVSGEVNADTWRVDRGGRIVEADIGVKHIAHRRDPDAPGGVSVESLPDEEAGRPALDEQQVVRVAQLARDAETLFSRPQDIEWAVAGGRLYLLQSRPITGLADRADPDGIRLIWDNSNIIESYSGVTTPLTFSFAQRAYEHVYREFCRLMRTPEDVIDSSGDMFACMLGLQRGRVYYNLLNWYRLIALLPGYRFNRRFMEQMMGVRERLPDGLTTALAPPQTGERLRDGVRLAGSLWGLVLAYFGLQKRVARFYARLDEALGQGRPSLSGLRLDELAAYYRTIERRLLTRWDAPIVNDFATMFFHGLLRKLTASWVGDAETLHNDLLSSQPGMICAETARKVRGMGELAARDPSLAKLLREGNLNEIHPALAGMPALQEAFRDYVETFGDRTTEELKLESPTLYDDPLPLLRSIGRYAGTVLAGGVSPGLDTEESRRHAADERVRQAFRGKPWRRVIFAWVLANARERVRDRENLRFERTRVFGRARQIAVEMGKRLAAVDRLDDPRDVFYLTLDELLAFIDGRAVTTDLKALAALRKTEFEGFRSEPPPPDRFETFGTVYVGNTFAPETRTPAPEGDSLSGLGCCSGVVRGPVRLVRDPGTTEVKSGEIIVAERTDPGWVTVFPSAAGLLVERGSLLSHSAIVAREIGLPTIVSLPGVTRWLEDGEWVEMNGVTGVVAKIPAPDDLQTDE